MTSTSDLDGVARGAVAGGFALAAGELAAAVLPGGRSPLTGLGRTMIDLLPGVAVDMTVATAEALDKPMLVVTLAGESLAVGALAATWPRRGELVLLAHGAVAGAAAASRPQSSSPSSLAAGLLGGAAGAAALRRLGRAGAGANEVLLATIAGAATGALARSVRRSQARRLDGRRDAVSLPRPTYPARPVPRSAQLDVAGLTPLLTPAGDFYTTDVSFPAPRVDPNVWRLRVHGMVDHPLSLTLDDLLAMELTEIDATLACVHNPVGGLRIGTGRWLGVPVADVLERAEVRPGAEQLVARSVDGFSAGVPVKSLTDGQHALIAVGLNGKALPFANGFPARLLVPGLWGADANTKWLDALELTTWAAVSDYWDARGWPRRPTPVRPGSRVDVPAHRAHLVAGPITVAGVAWAPPDGVHGVEISIDGQLWQPAEVADELAPTAWRQWRVEWEATPGEHRLRVRTLGRSAIQPEKLAPPYPRGSGGHHEILVWAHKTLPAQTPLVRRTGQLTNAVADVRSRLALAAMAPPAWIAHGYPRVSAFRAPDAR